MGLFTKEKKITGQVITVNVKEIDLNPNQPRKYFDKAELESLAISIKENGLLQPLTVRKKSDVRYELILAGVNVPIFVKKKKIFDGIIAGICTVICFVTGVIILMFG